MYDRCRDGVGNWKTDARLTSMSATTMVTVVTVMMVMVTMMTIVMTMMAVMTVMMTMVTVMVTTMMTTTITCSAVSVFRSSWSCFLSLLLFLYNTSSVPEVAAFWVFVYERKEKKRFRNIL